MEQREAVNPSADAIEMNSDFDDIDIEVMVERGATGEQIEDLIEFFLANRIVTTLDEVYDFVTSVIGNVSLARVRDALRRLGIPLPCSLFASPLIFELPKHEVAELVASKVVEKLRRGRQRCSVGSTRLNGDRIVVTVTGSGRKKVVSVYMNGYRHAIEV